MQFEGEKPSRERRNRCGDLTNHARSTYVHERTDHGKEAVTGARYRKPPQKKNQSAPSPEKRPEAVEETVTFTMRPLSDAAISFITGIPDMGEKGYDFVRIPENTLRALREAGLQPDPFVTPKGGRHMVRLGKDVLSHTEAIELLKNTARIQRDEEELIARLREVVPEAKGVPKQRTGKPRPDQTIPLRGAAFGLIPGDDVVSTGEPAYFGDGEGGGEIYRETMRGDVREIAELADNGASSENRSGILETQGGMNESESLPNNAPGESDTVPAEVGSYRAEEPEAVSQIDGADLDSLRRWYPHVDIVDGAIQLHGKSGSMFTITPGEVGRLIHMNKERDMLRETESVTRSPEYDENENREAIVNYFSETKQIPVLDDEIVDDFSETTQIPVLTDIVSEDKFVSAGGSTHESSENQRLTLVQRALKKIKQFSDVRVREDGRFEITKNDGSVITASLNSAFMLIEKYGAPLEGQEDGTGSTQENKTVAPRETGVSNEGGVEPERIEDDVLSSSLTVEAHQKMVIEGGVANSELMVKEGAEVIVAGALSRVSVILENGAVLRVGGSCSHSQIVVKSSGSLEIHGSVNKGSITIEEGGRYYIGGANMGCAIEMKEQSTPSENLVSRTETASDNADDVKEAVATNPGDEQEFLLRYQQWFRGGRKGPRPTIDSVEMERRRREAVSVEEQPSAQDSEPMQEERAQSVETPSLELAPQEVVEEAAGVVSDTSRVENARAEATLRADVLREEEGNDVFEEEPREQTAKRTKPHLNNAESIAYLKRVQEMREEERRKKGGEGTLSETNSAPVQVNETGDPYWKAIDGQIDPKFNDAGTLESLGKTSPVTSVDIELPLNPQDGVISGKTPKAEAVAKQHEQSSPERKAIEDEIRFLERVQASKTFPAQQFMERYPDFKNLYEKSSGITRRMLVDTWVDNQLGPLREQLSKMEIPSGFFDERFTKEFGIQAAELAKVEGFKELSKEQQMLVYENLKEYRDDEAQGRFGAMWSTIKRTMGVPAEKRPLKGDFGMDAYGDFLSKLVFATAKYGPKVHLENGKLLTDFVGMHMDREHRAEQKEVIDGLNSAAHAFARIPASWQEDANGVHAKNESKVTSFFKEKFLGGTESRQHYREYEAVRKQYEAAKRAFAQRLEDTGVPRDQIVRKLIEVDGKVLETRFVETNPEAANLVKDIPDTGFWNTVGEKMKEGGVYAGIGMGARVATADALKVLSGPVVATVLGGTRAWNKTAAEQRERDRKARLGVGDTSESALNIVAAEQVIQTEKGPMDMGVTAKLERDIAAYNALPHDADAKERTRIIGKIRAGASQAEDKLNLNRIQFGNKDSYAVNRARFLEAFAEAKIIAENESGVSETPLEARAKRYLSYREGSINDRRHKEQRRRVAIEATKAAAISAAGALAMNEFLNSDMGKSAVGKVKNWFNWSEWSTGDKVSSGGQERGSGLGGGQENVPTRAADVTPPPRPEVRAPAGYVEEVGKPEVTPQPSSQAAPELTPPEPPLVSPEEREAILKQFEEDAPTQPTQPASPSPVSPERVDVQAPASEAEAPLDQATQERAYEKARAIESYFVNTHVNRNDWVRVRTSPALNLMADSLEEANRRRMPHALRQLGKFFYEMGKPPFSVDPLSREPTEAFFGRALRAMTEAEARGEDVSKLRGYITNVKKDWFNAPFKSVYRR